VSFFSRRGVGLKRVGGGGGGEGRGEVGVGGGMEVGLQLAGVGCW
jgi:hypothetical protein